MPTFPRPRILFVDDDVLLLRAVERALVDDGLEVLSTNGPMGVREMITTFRPAIVLVDVNIPLLKGDELVILARTAAATTGAMPRFILYSALDDSDLAARAKASGADGWISKNHPIERLGERLRTFL
ncbi:hypothetical protein BH09MYX1_BH09MYX1_45050 [soil metagenome]